MKKKFLYANLAILWLILHPPLGVCLKTEDIIRLKKAGITEETIQLLIREKTIETRAYTIEEILTLKKAGLKDETIQLLIKEGSYLKDRQPVVYGRDVKPLKFATVEDILRLKNAGVSDEVIMAIITDLKSEDEAAREKAWKMLESMEIRIDMRDVE